MRVFSFSGRALKGLVAAAILGICAAAIGSGRALGRDWYVAVDAKVKTGTVEAGTVESPAGLFDAIKNAAAGDTIFLRGGEYKLTQQILLDKERLTLRNYPGEKPVLTMPIDDPKLRSAVTAYAKGCQVTGLEIIGGSWYCVKSDYAGTLIRDSVLHGSGHDCIKLGGRPDGTVIENCEIYDSGRTFPSNAEGIDNVSGDDIIVRNCYVHDIATNGIYMKGGASRCVVEGNVVTDCGDNGIMLGQSTDKNLIRIPPYECYDSVARRNFVTRIRGAGMAFEAANRCRFENNTIYDSGRRNHGGISIHANEHGTPSKDVVITQNTVMVLGGLPMIAVHRGGLEAMADMQCDGNVYHSPSGVYKFAWDPTGLVANGLVEWRRATGYDMHSTSTGPGGQSEGPIEKGPAADKPAI